VDDQNRRSEINAALEREVDRLLGTVEALRGGDASLPLSEIEPLVSSLSRNMGLLEDLVSRRLDVTAQIGELRRSITETNQQVDRLLAPWVEVVDGEITTLSASSARDAPSRPGIGPLLASRLDLQRNLRA